MEMDPTLDISNLFSEMIQRIQEQIDLSAVILIGSRARGDAKYYSDFDIVIIGNFNAPYIERIKWALWYTPSVPVDIFCYTPEEFNTRFYSYQLIAIDAIGEGMVLYGDDFIEPYKLQYKKFVEHGMRKTSCTLIPPSL